MIPQSELYSTESELFHPEWPHPDEDGHCTHPETPEQKSDRVRMRVPDVQVGQRTRRFKRAKDSGKGTEAVIH